MLSDTVEVFFIFFQISFSITIMNVYHLDFSPGSFKSI